MKMNFPYTGLKIVLLVQPSSAAAEHVFSSFSDQQTSMILKIFHHAPIESCFFLFKNREFWAQSRELWVNFKALWANVGIKE